jgi:hypothetical protein
MPNLNVSDLDTRIAHVGGKTHTALWLGDMMSSNVKGIDLTEKDLDDSVALIGNSSRLATLAQLLFVRHLAGRDPALAEKVLAQMDKLADDEIPELDGYDPGDHGA